MIHKGNQQVSPKAAAAIILMVLILIQVVWWRGLVTRPQGNRPRGGGSGGSLGPPLPPVVVGRRDVDVATLAGDPQPGDADGPGFSARFDSPVGLAVDAQGRLYVADSGNNRIRIVAPNGDTTTLAGTTPGYADGPVSTARFNLPCGVAVGPDGSVYVADTGNHRLRRIKDGQVTTLAGSVPGLAEGTGSTAKFDSPGDIVYSAGSKPSLLVADTLNRRVRRVSLAGEAAGGWSTIGPPVGLMDGAAPAAAVPSVGLMMKGAAAVSNIPIDMQGENASQTEFTLRRPVAVCAAPGGLFVTDGEQSALFYVHDGIADVIAGHSQGHHRAMGWEDGDGHRAYFGLVNGVAADGDGHVYVSDTSNNAIRRITLPADLRAPDGRRSTER